MKTFNCNIEINKNKTKQPKFSFNEKCNTNNLLKNESAFESIELKKEEEEEKFTLDFLIESNKTSVLSVFKGKII
ncbi:hypothetical protein [Campylobacter coli]|uniref:hypothetical protein n=1 Tax=Campylobacter coli TaxID=195 RepID=UPI0012F48D74|nr:hypothetical protein [Campylobacter coli]